MTRVQPDAGFSLIEVLVSVFIFAILGAMSVAVLSSSLTAKDVSEASLARTAALDRMRTLMRDDLGQIADRPVRDADGYREPYRFAGDGNGLPAGTGRQDRVLMRFTRHGQANPGLLRPRSSLVRVEYVLRDDRLVRRAWAYPDAAAAAVPSEQVLAEGVSALELDFLTGPTWMRRALLPAESRSVGQSGFLCFGALASGLARNLREQHLVRCSARD